MGSLRRVAVIALGEARRTGGSFDRKGLLVMLVLGLVFGLLAPQVIGNGLDFDRGLYRVAITPGHPLQPAVESDRTFQVILTDDPNAVLHAGHADVAVAHDLARAADGEKGQAALAALEKAAKAHTFHLMTLEGDPAAAFPVRVDVQYEEQAREPGAPRLSDVNDARDATRRDTDDGDDDANREGRTDGGNGDANDPDGTPPPQPRDGDGDGGFDLFGTRGASDTPGSLAPPFPFRSLLLAYVFLIPLNFIVQVYAGSAIHERLGRKGEAMLASPARRWEMIAGKALPYFLLMMLAGTGIAWAIGGSWLSLLAVLPIALSFLAFQFVAAMFARSFRELTFLTVFTSVLLTVYCFLPAVFTSVHPVALISPITLVVMDLKGAAVTPAAIAYSMSPLLLVSAVLFVLGGALYREEDMFHQKPVFQKAVDAVASQVHGPWSAFKLTALLMPFVFVAELLLITFLHAWPFPSGVLTTLLAVALVEEAFKAAPSYAGLRRDRVPRTAKRALVFGALAGLGFFAAEKAFLLASLVGLYDLQAGSAVLGAGTPATATALWPLLLIAPLILHVVTASISAWGARHTRGTFLLAFTAAILVHALYNLGVLTFVGGGLP